ncbi:hypothetical protein LOTGIDRAFT_231884 [Lottia gigantea]|uniref:WAP domain-containing protein n=1 Tax=Lottia gigantea TaxID=225164 RepID=V4APT8_LOTGI|nr:hypothetical protein LOTGIDRAFT_231884 [Lottia gigantea]ESO95651.1 hypothetical protein LOTGIDRAFT_231884 [Lottia gigantea]
MIKLLILTVVIPCLFQVANGLSFAKPMKEILPQTLPPPTTMGPPPDMIHPDDVVTDSSNLPCTDSSQCPAGYSCRDSNGNIKYNQETAWGPIEPFGPPGNCGCAAKPGEVCVGNNDCPKGYECYRQMSGACCPPSHCVTTEYAEYWRTYWSNCFPPHCYLPAK